MSHLAPLQVNDRPDWFNVKTYINRLIRGRDNAVGTVTLTNGASSTTLTDLNIKRGSIVLLMAQTAHASAVTALWVDPTSVPANGGTITINHSLIAFADCTFGYTVRT